MIFTLLTSFCALVLGATLYAMTRDQDPDLAMLALTCRVGGGVIGGLSVNRSMGLAWLGVLASVLLVVGLPLQLAGVLSGSDIMLAWYLMLAFEVPLALWLMIKGAAIPARQ